MFDPKDNSYEYFGGTIGPELLECLSHQGLKTKIVGQAELLPCLVARYAGTRYICFCFICFFKPSLVSCFSLFLLLSLSGRSSRSLGASELLKVPCIRSHTVETLETTRNFM